MSNKITNMWRRYNSVLLVLILFVLSPGIASAYGVTFGTSQNDGTPCVGKGVCKEAVNLDPSTLNYTDFPEAVTITFQVSPDNPNVLMMSFLLSELTKKQPDQVAYFTSPSASYPFDATFTFAGTVLAGIPGLPSNAAISTTSNSVVVINGDIVTDYITLSSN